LEKGNEEILYHPPAISSVADIIEPTLLEEDEMTFDDVLQTCEEESVAGPSTSTALNKKTKFCKTSRKERVVQINSGRKLIFKLIYVNGIILVKNIIKEKHKNLEIHTRARGHTHTHINTK